MATAGSNGGDLGLIVEAAAEEIWGPGSSWPAWIDVAAASASTARACARILRARGTALELAAELEAHAQRLEDGEA